MRNCFTSIVVVLCTLLSACATGYQPEDANGAGFTDQQVTKNSYLVAYVGNAYTSQQKIHDYAMLFAAQVTVNHGYRYFMVTGEKPVPSYSRLKL